LWVGDVYDSGGGSVGSVVEVHVMGLVGYDSYYVVILVVADCAFV
jgi:hypothetical protein